MTTAMHRLPADARYRGLQPMGCDACERGFLLAREESMCPLCGSEGLAPRPARVLDAPPELQVAFRIGADDLRGKLEPFTRGVRFRTSDLDAARMAERAVQVWWPVWLVDATCAGRFEAEVGTDYRVRSTDEVLEGGRWVTREVERTRIRWEPRVGGVQRRYDNVAAPASSEHEVVGRRLGGWSVQGAGPVAVAPERVVLPDRDPDEAWPEALDELVHQVGADVKEAVGADHVRAVSVQAEWEDREHTWMLLPVYATWYRDDAGERCAVWVHGVTGKAWGPRRASMRKALMWSALAGTLATAMLLAAGLLGVVGIVVVLLLPVAAALGMVAVPLYLLALWPPLHVWSNNRRELPEMTRRKG